MKMFLCVLMSALVWGVAAPSEQPAVKLSDEELGDKLQQAVVLAKFGFYDEAEAKLKEILEQKPDQPTVKQLLREIDEMRERSGRNDAAADFKRKLNDTIVPSVEFREADPAQVIDYLRAESKKLTPDKSPINIVWLVPADATLPRVSLNLRKIPFLDVVKYVAQASGLRYRVDAHAVVIEKLAPPPAPVASSDSNAKPQ